MSNNDTPFLDLNGSEYLNNQYPLIEEFRKKSWYAKTESGYVFFNQKEAAHFLRDSAYRFSYYYIDAEASPYLADRVQGMLLAKNGADHARLRILVMRALRDRIIDALNDSIRQIVDDLIAALPRSGTVDLAEAFTNRIPERVLGPMLGIEYDRVKEIDEWIRVSSHSIDAVNAKSEIHAIEDAWRKLEQFLANLLDERRNNLGNDIFSELIAAENEGDRLSSEELTGITMELARAGVETTRNQLTLIIYQLLTHPEQWELLQADPSLAANAVEEGMRYSPLPHVIPQQAIRDNEYNGLSIKEGEIAMVLIPAANRDPLIMDNAHEFNITREQKMHYSFGFGPHVCPAAHLARMEMRTGLEALAKHIKRWQLVEQPNRSSLSSGGVPQQLMVELELN